MNMTRRKKKIYCTIWNGIEILDSDIIMNKIQLKKL